MDGWTARPTAGYFSPGDIFSGDWDLEGRVAHWQWERPAKCLAGSELYQYVGMDGMG
jgi:hypothetical protein